MGLHFGELATIRGIYYYRLAPHELRPLAGLLTRGLPNVIPRTSARIYTWLPRTLIQIYSTEESFILGLSACITYITIAFVIGYVWFVYVEWAFKQSKRKDPKDYINEVNPNPPPPPPPPPKKCPPKD